MYIWHNSNLTYHGQVYTFVVQPLFISVVAFALYDANCA